MAYKCYRINYLNGMFWLKPSFVKQLFSTRGSILRPFNSLKDLINQMDILFLNCYFIFNENDLNWKFFNELMKMKEINFQLNLTVVNQIMQNQSVKTKISETVFIEWDKTSLEAIKKGYLPFFNINYFDVLYQEISKARKILDENKKLIFSWRKNGYIFIQECN